MKPERGWRAIDSWEKFDEGSASFVISLKKNSHSLLADISILISQLSPPRILITKDKKGIS